MELTMESAAKESHNNINLRMEEKPRMAVPKEAKNEYKIVRF